MYTIRPPFFLRWYYPELIWQKNKQQKIVYLTFDDGPIVNVTEFVLDTLKKYQIKATFFCIGDNIRKYPAVFNRIKLENHSIGNHTFHHLKGWKTTDKVYLNNFIQCQELTQSNLFRPPYGRIKKSQIKSITKYFIENNNSKHLDFVMWDVLSGDFDTTIDAKQCFNNVRNNVRNGSIVVFHDSLKAWDRLKKALPESIEFLLNEGYRFETL